MTIKIKKLRIKPIIRLKAIKYFDIVIISDKLFHSFINKNSDLFLLQFDLQEGNCLFIVPSIMIMNLMSKNIIKTKILIIS